MKCRTMLPTALLPATAAVFFTLASVAQPSNDVPGVGEPGGPLQTLSRTEMSTWLSGRALFDRDFHFDDGVGLPGFNGDSCRACHQDPILGGAGPLELNVARFAHNNGGQGPFMDLPGGQAQSKLGPTDVFGRENEHPMSDVFEQRQTPSILGLGLLDAVPDSEILANQDRSDSNGDGIFGVARMVTIGGNVEVGRFGWKAQVPRLDDFVRDAMAGELGMTTSDNGRGFGVSTDTDAIPDPELSDSDALDVGFFMRNMGPPARTGSQAAEVLQGELLFDQLMCNRCHVPTLQSSLGPVNAYTDLLLHDVWPTSFRGMEEPGAPSGFYRTPPLWGIKDTAPYMHDGRAETLLQAISLHAGEASASATGFLFLTPQQQVALIAFLEDL